MKLYLGADHNGHELKEKIFAHLSKQSIEVTDVSPGELDPNDDFPEFAQRAALKILGDDDDNARAILICGGGQGMCMAANRFRGIRASVCWDVHEAKMTRRDNDSNVLCLPGRLLQPDGQEWKDIVDTWINTPFDAAERYKRRNRQIDALG